MGTEHHDNKSQGIITSVEPATLINVKVVEIQKTVEVPIFKDVEVEKPIFVEKEFERPVIKDKKYERPVIIDKEYERPVIVNKEIVVEVPVPVEKPYDKPVPVEVPYDIPVVSMTKINDLASQAVSTLDKAKDMLKEINAAIMLLSDTIANVKETIPEEIKMPKITYEQVTVKDVKVVEETIHVIGRVVAKDR